MPMVRTLAAILSILTIVLPAAAGKFVYPETHRGDVVENYHGTEVADPYRWLEDLDAPETAAWVEAQNAVTFSFLESIEAREKIAGRLTELWNFPRVSIPYPVGGMYVFAKNSGLQNQDVLYMQKSLDREPEILLDPNGHSEDGTVALASLAFSKDGRYMMYGTSASGSDWQTLHVRDIKRGIDLPDELNWIKFAAVAWRADGEGFFYSRFEAPAAGEEFEQQNKNQKVYFHRVGTAQEKDELIYARPDDPDLGLDPYITEDGRYLIVVVSRGTDRRVGIHYIDLTNEPYRVVRLLDDFDARYGLLGNRGTEFYFLTDRGAPNFRVVAVDIGDPAPEKWREVVPEGDGVFETGKIIAGRLVLQALVDVKSRLTIHGLDGSFAKEIALPAIGSVDSYGYRPLRHLGGLAGRQDGDEMFYRFESFIYPGTVYRYDFEKEEVTVFHAPEIDFDASRYVTRQVFYESKDGTKIPMFLVHRKDMVQNGENPTYVYAYGGFNINMSPCFRARNLVWLEMGGIYALPNLRGGGEYGERWHQAGCLANKQNGIDDFIAAAEYMIDEKYTNRSKLSIHGGSNGGLMTAACLTQRPDLFGAVIVDVGVLDMLRYHMWTIGWAWASDYGTSADPEQFAYLYKYSPLHNLEPGTGYPATLVVTADHDDRVVPSHSFKFAAALQAAQAGDAPTLIRVETKAGHGAGMPTSKRIQEKVDMWTFLAEVLGVDVDL